MRLFVQGVALGLGFALSLVSLADTTAVNGYYKKDGTYVPPHVRTTPNATKMDNWSTKGNVNPYTGKEGTQEPNPRRYRR